MLASRLTCLAVSRVSGPPESSGGVNSGADLDFRALPPFTRTAGRASRPSADRVRSVSRR